MESLLLYFTDPILRAPTIGSMLMCLAAALIGVIAYLRKESLLGEALSHASYPGVILGAIFATTWIDGDLNQVWPAIFTLAGAFLSALLGNYAIYFLETRWKIKSDSALCFVLSIFFGIGILLASLIQFTHSALYKQSLSYLYGQAATMDDGHVMLYGLLSLSVIGTIFLFYKELKVVTFDRDYARSLGLRVKLIDTIVLIFLSLSIVVGIRSVGVVLMSAMLIAPAASARQYTNRLSYMLLLAALFGLFSGFVGNVISTEITTYLSLKYPMQRLSLPTGPMIVLIASMICIFSLLFAPQRGLCTRLIRIIYFRSRCLRENILKTMWRQGKDRSFTLDEIKHTQPISKVYLWLVLFSLMHQGWIQCQRGNYSLTSDGIQRAAQILRLHRLWEVYLCDYLGVGVERVHKSAEEMEHILTPELERELTVLLNDPQLDPHQQPIPPPGGIK